MVGFIIDKIERRSAALPKRKKRFKYVLGLTASYGYYKDERKNRAIGMIRGYENVKFSLAMIYNIQLVGLWAFVCSILLAGLGFFSIPNISLVLFLISTIIIFVKNPDRMLSQEKYNELIAIKNRLPTSVLRRLVIRTSLVFVRHFLVFAVVEMPIYTLMAFYIGKCIRL